LNRSGYSRCLKSAAGLIIFNLHSRILKYLKQGPTQVNNQIILDTDGYKWFEFGGKGWIEGINRCIRFLR
jgi:hypothetical protein